MVRLSQYPEYLAAIPAAASGDFAAARSNLDALLVRIEAHADAEHLAYVVQLMADVEAQAGNIEKALTLHERALAIDGSSPLARLNCAKSLVSRLNLPALALERLHEAETLLASSHWQPSEHDMSRQWYEREIQSVRALALGA